MRLKRQDFSHDEGFGSFTKLFDRFDFDSCVRESSSNLFSGRNKTRDQFA
jgi:hypothetical protein